MTLAILLVVAAAVALVFILGVALSRSLQLSARTNLAAQIQPIDVLGLSASLTMSEDVICIFPPAGCGVSAPDLKTSCCMAAIHRREEIREF